MLSFPVYPEPHSRSFASHPRLTSAPLCFSQPSNLPTCKCAFCIPNAAAGRSWFQHTRNLSIPHRCPFATAYPISPLAATLTDLPASVANKRLTVILTPLNATLTKNRGEGCSQHSDLPTCKPSNGVLALCSLFALFTPRVFHNSFAFRRFRTLSQKRGVYGGLNIQFLKDHLKSAATDLTAATLIALVSSNSVNYSQGMHRV
jgi:hypothetical protein